MTDPPAAPGRGRPSRAGAAPAALVAILVVVLPGTLSGQADEWNVEGEVGASLFYGNTDQTVVNTRTAVAHADSTAEISGDVQFIYGQSTDEGGTSFVSKRYWLANTSVDYRPLERVNAFFSGSVESSLQKKIDLRWNVGLGAKVGVVRTNFTRVELRVALLGERTRFVPSVTDGDEELLARWSAKLRVRRATGNERVVFSSETSYRPNAGDIEDFTMVSTNAISVDVSDYVRLKVSLVDNFDSLAEERGALSDNDGQVFFGVLSSFD